MEISPVLQATLMLLSAVCGVASGVLRDFLEASEQMLSSKRKRPWAVCFAFDFFVVLLLCGTLIVLSFYFNNGDVRGFVIIGAVAGFALYKLSASRLVKAAFLRVLRLFFRGIAAVMSPVVKLLKILLGFLKKTVYSIHKTLEKTNDMVYNIYVKKYVLRNARRGFLGGKLK